MAPTAEASAGVDRADPDVLVLDLSLPYRSGIEPLDELPLIGV